MQPDAVAVRAHLAAERNDGSYDHQWRQSVVDQIRRLTGDNTFDRATLAKRLALIEPASERRAR